MINNLKCIEVLIPNNQGYIKYSCDTEDTWSFVKNFLSYYLKLLDFKIESEAYRYLYELVLLTIKSRLIKKELPFYLLLDIVNLKHYSSHAKTIQVLINSLSPHYFKFSTSDFGNKKYSVEMITLEIASIIMKGMKENTLVIAEEQTRKIEAEIQVLMNAKEEIAIKYMPVERIKTYYKNTTISLDTYLYLLGFACGSKGYLYIQKCYEYALFTNYIPKGLQHLIQHVMIKEETSVNTIVWYLNKEINMVINQTATPLSTAVHSSYQTNRNIVYTFFLNSLYFLRENNITVLAPTMLHDLVKKQDIDNFINKLSKRNRHDVLIFEVLHNLLIHTFAKWENLSLSFNELFNMSRMTKTANQDYVKKNLIKAFYTIDYDTNELKEFKPYIMRVGTDLTNMKIIHICITYLLEKKIYEGIYNHH